MINAFLKQAWIVSGILLTMLILGSYLGFTSCLLPALEDPDSLINATLEESSWITASSSPASVLGFLPSSYLMDRIGRRKTYFLSMIPGAIGMILMYFATNVSCLIAARVLQGMTTGACSILAAIVVGEYTSPVHRGMFLNLKTVAVCIGSTLVHLLGNYYHWRTVALLTLIPYLAAFGIVYTWPESPSWLASEKRFDKSREVFYNLRGNTEQSTKELNDMIKAQEERIKEENLTILKSIMNFIRKFGKRDFVMPVLNYFFAVTLLEFSGRYIFPAYADQIMSEISGASDPFYYTLVLDILAIVSATFSSLLIRMFKRRTLLFTTGFASVLILLSACCHHFLGSRNIIPHSSWIPVSLFGLYFALVNLACVPIPLALLGEIFPLEHRAAGTAIAGILIAVISMVTLKTMPFMVASVTIYGTFTILGVVMAISLIFLYVMLPETKDRTLQEIEYFFSHGQFRNDVKSSEKEDTQKEEPKVIP